ncbi:MAG: hypothetical protein ACLRWL_00065 [Evtepia gabavorous]
MQWTVAGLFLTVEGHTGLAEAGEDILCRRHQRRSPHRCAVNDVLGLEPR